MQLQPPSTTLSFESIQQFFAYLLNQWHASHYIHLIKTVAEAYQSYLEVMINQTPIAAKNNLQSNHEDIIHTWEMLISRVKSLALLGFIDEKQLPQLQSIIDDIQNNIARVKRNIRTHINLEAKEKEEKVSQKACLAFLRKIEAIVSKFTKLKDESSTTLIKEGNPISIQDTKAILEKRIADGEMFYQLGEGALKEKQYLDAITFFGKAFNILNAARENVPLSNFKRIRAKIAACYYHFAHTIVDQSHRPNADPQVDWLEIFNELMKKAIQQLLAIHVKENDDYKKIAEYYTAMAVVNEKKALPNCIHALKFAMTYLSQIDNDSAKQVLLSTAMRLISIYHKEAKRAFKAKHYGLAYIQCRQAIAIYKQQYNAYADRTAVQSENKHPKMTQIYVLLAATLMEDAKLLNDKKHKNDQEALYRLQEASCMLNERLSAIAKLSEKDEAMLETMRQKIAVEQELLSSLY